MATANSKETAAERPEKTAASPGGAAAIPKVAVKNPEGRPRVTEKTLYRCARKP
jgi:hypothetical protein